MIANAAKVFKNETKKSRNGIAYCYNHSVKHERALTVLKCVGDKHLVCVLAVMALNLLDQCKQHLAV